MVVGVSITIANTAEVNGARLLLNKDLSQTIIDVLSVFDLKKLIKLSNLILLNYCNTNIRQSFQLQLVPSLTGNFKIYHSRINFTMS